VGEFSPAGDDSGETPQCHPMQRFNQLAKPLLGNASFPSNQRLLMENPSGTKSPPASALRGACPDSQVLHPKVASKMGAPKRIKLQRIYLYVNFS